MKVHMNRSVAVKGGVYTRGREADLPDGVAASMVAAGHATPLDPDDLDALQEPVEVAPDPVEDDEAGAEADEQSEEQSEDEADEDDEADGEPSDEDDEADESEPAAESDDLDSMKLPELRELAAERGLPTSGNKPALIERLRGE